VRSIRVPLLILALAVVMGCGDSSARKTEATVPPGGPTVTDTKPSGAQDASITAPLDVPANGPLVPCEGLVRIHEAMERCEPSAQGKAYIRRGRDELPNLWANAKDIDTRREAARGCALMLGQLAAGLAASCPVSLTADEQVWVERETSRRTTIPPTGDPAIDARIARFLELRDAVCACRDRACAEAVERESHEVGAGLFFNQSKAVRDAGGKVSDEMLRCRMKAAP
jgi:hypothetical protein